MKFNRIMAFTIGPIGAALLGLITMPFVAWLFSPDDIGRLSMLQVVLSFSLLLSSLGLDQAYVREYHEVNDKPGLLKSVMAPGLIVQFVFLICIVFMPWSASKILFGIESSALTLIVTLSIFISFFSRFLSLILRMEERGLAFSMSQVLPKLIFLIILFSYAFASTELQYFHLLLANFISLLTVLSIFIWSTRSSLRLALTSNIDKAKQRIMIGYAIPLIGSGMAFWGLTAMDKFFLRGISNFEQLGIYAVSVTFAGAALVFQAIFSTVWAPTVYKWAAEGIDPAKIKNVTDYVMLGVITIWSFAGVFSWLLAYVLPSEYYQVPHILLAAMAYPLLYTLAEVTGIGVGIKRRTMYTLLAAIASLIVNAIGNTILIPIYGARGAAISSAIAFAVVFLVKTEASSRLWFRFQSNIMYPFVSLMVVSSCIVNLWEFPNCVVSFWYILILIVGIAAYWKQAKGVCSFISSRVYK